MCICQSQLPIYPSPFFFLLTTSLFSTSVTISVLQTGSFVPFLKFHIKVIYWWCKPSELGFSASSLLTFWTRWFFIVGDCSVHCRVFCSILSLCPVGASSNSPAITIKNVSRHCQVCPGRQNHPQLSQLLLYGSSMGSPFIHPVHTGFELCLLYAWSHENQNSRLFCSSNALKKKTTYFSVLFFSSPIFLKGVSAHMGVSQNSQSATLPEMGTILAFFFLFLFIQSSFSLLLSNSYL